MSSFESASFGRSSFGEAGFMSQTSFNGSVHDHPLDPDDVNSAETARNLAARNSYTSDTIKGEKVNFQRNNAANATPMNISAKLDEATNYLKDKIFSFSDWTLQATAVAIHVAVAIVALTAGTVMGSGLVVITAIGGSVGIGLLAHSWNASLLRTERPFNKIFPDVARASVEGQGLLFFASTTIATFGVIHLFALVSLGIIAYKANDIRDMDKRLRA